MATIGATLAIAAGGGAALAGASAERARQDTGGLSLSPAVLQQTAKAGPLGPFTVFNRSKETLDVTVTARPWRQAQDGTVTPDRRHKLVGVAVAQRSFSLAPGASQVVNASLTSMPSAGALYGALEVIGLPTDADTRKGVVLGYRLIGTLRLRPATPKHRLAARLATAGQAIVLDVRNLGNTLDPVSGTATIKDARGTRSPDFDDLRILPGERVRVRLAKGLAKGSYRANVRLSQAGRRALSLKKKLNIR
jgi:hypothetical protein